MVMSVVMVRLVNRHRDRDRNRDRDRAWNWCVVGMAGSDDDVALSAATGQRQVGHAEQQGQPD